MSKQLIAASILSVCSGFSPYLYGQEAFTTCPSEAYLYQGNPVSVFGVDLLTGQYELLSNDSSLPGNINAVGFNFTDRFIYGFNTSLFSVVKIDRYFQAEELNVTGLPSNTTFYVGDVLNNAYWVYRKKVGLFRISLDENDETFLTAVKFESANTSLTLTDFAFHPGDDQLYAIDNKTGILYRISVDSGEATGLGYTGITGTFGAGYFDVNGYYYVSRNQDGHVFRVNLSDPNVPVPTAQFFAYGPYSSQNDGARCAYAPLSVMNIDWGDAPDSYGTSLAENGARHQISESLFLGLELGDGEPDGSVWPLSDDTDGYDDEDGVSWTDTWQVGLDVELNVGIVGSGFLHAWVDWNRDGIFDPETENITSSLPVDTGNVKVPVRIPDDAVAGETWMRVRLSSQEALLPKGGAVDGEVEDYALELVATPLTKRYYPSQNGWATLAYEDTWPNTGDYDMNDVVLHYRLVETFVNGEVKRIDIQGQIVALGAAYQSGFSVQLPDFSSANVNKLRTFEKIGNNFQYFSVVRSDDVLVVDVVPNLNVTQGSSCAFFRTRTECPDSVSVEFDVGLPMLNGIDATLLPSFPYNPFIFGVAEQWRGEWLAEFEKNRIEVHLPMHSGTGAVPDELWGLADDDSQPDLARYYQTPTNLPWALLIPEPWDHPIEARSITEAYPRFVDWVESSGSEWSDWYLPENANQSNVFK
jgi:LruC domain-containing protein